MKQPLHILIAGPYISNYSLAVMNRGLALALARLFPEHKVSIWQDPPFAIDKRPKDKDLPIYPGVEKLLTNNVDNVDVLIYCNYPSDASKGYELDALPGRVKLMYLAWEETVFPEHRRDELNRELHGLMTISSFVRDVMKRNKVAIPTKPILIALDDEFFSYEHKPYPLETKKSFKFFHLSTAKHRKGVDLLLKAYFEEFSDKDDVVLVIKSFPGPDNQINAQLGELAKLRINSPEVIHIFNPELTRKEVIDLTGAIDCAVYPSRSEGFGLPVAEAMYLKKPVIVTGYSGMMDFCNDENCLLLDYEIADTTDSEMVNLGAKWAEPSLEDLKKKMREVYEQRDSEKFAEMTEKAHEAVKKLTWDNTARNVLNFMDEVTKFAQLKEKKLGILSAINSVNGIAEYTRDLYSNVEASFKKVYYLANSDIADRTRPDNENVVRLWEYGEQDFGRLLEWLKENPIDILHVQYHPAELPVQSLGKLIEHLRAAQQEIRLFLTPHAVVAAGLDLADIGTQLSSLDTIFVHKQGDLEHMQSAGVTNLELFPLPFDTYPVFPKGKLRSQLGIETSGPVLATHGLISHHKGLLEVAEAVAILKQDYPDIIWLAVNALNINNTSSSDTYEKLQAKIKELGIETNVILIPDFIADPIEIVTLLQAADIGILAYSEVGESASAAVRKFLAANLATIVTNIPMMKELDKEVLKINTNSPEAIAEGIRELITHPEKRAGIAKQALHTSQKYSWENMALSMILEYAKELRDPEE